MDLLAISAPERCHGLISGIISDVEKGFLDNVVLKYDMRMMLEDDQSTTYDERIVFPFDVVKKGRNRRSGRR